jgi:hypothetical protein
VVARDAVPVKVLEQDCRRDVFAQVPAGDAVAASVIERL